MCADIPAQAAVDPRRLIGRARLAEASHQLQQITRTDRSRLADRGVADRVVDRVLGEETKWGGKSKI